MPIHIAAIQSRSIAAFHAEGRGDAEARVRGRLFRDDLMVLATDGVRCGMVLRTSRCRKSAWRDDTALLDWLSSL
jgi:hypothetical protein